MMLFKHVSLIVLLFLPTCIYSTEKCSIMIYDTGGRQVRIDVEKAVTPAEKEKGLMHRTFLPADSGMLFVFDRENYQNFWMKDTLIPLSIAYIDTYGIIREIYDMKPLDTSIVYPSKYPVRYALEVNRGWFTRNKIRPGCRILLNGCIGKSNTIIGR